MRPGERERRHFWVQALGYSYAKARDDGRQRQDCRGAAPQGPPKLKDARRGVKEPPLAAHRSA
jgi:hypothetical protein